MKRKQRQRRVGLLCTISITLLSVGLVPALICSQSAGRSEEPSSPIPTAAVASPGAASNLSPALSSGTQPAPNAPGSPFLRFVAVLCSGLVITAARLARKFRRFWGLGVFTNFSAVLFLLVGAGICSSTVLSEKLLRSIPAVGPAGSWIAGLLGIVATLILPGIRLGSSARSGGERQVRDLENDPSSNPIIAFIEDGVRDCILRRMQSEMVKISRRFDWDTIRRAARRALIEEMTIRPLGREEYEDARQSIEEFKAEADLRLDSSNKYEALVGVLRWCSFKRLIRGLNADAGEAKP